MVYRSSKLTLVQVEWHEDRRQQYTIQTLVDDTETTTHIPDLIGLPI